MSLILHASLTTPLTAETCCVLLSQEGLAMGVALAGGVSTDVASTESALCIGFSLFGALSTARGRGEHAYLLEDE